jgi:hypothetical protein
MGGFELAASVAAGARACIRWQAKTVEDRPKARTTTIRMAN